MAKSYKKFNLICAILSAFFLLVAIWIWRGVWVEVRREKKMSETMVVEKPGAVVVDENKIEDLRLKIIDDAEEKLSVGVTTTVATPTIKIVETLPKQINLDVPFTSQAPEKNWDQPWQDACEEAALLMLDAYYKGYNLSPLFARDEILKIVAWEEAQGWERSIEMEKIAKVVDEYFSSQKFIKSIKLKVVIDPTVQQIKEFIANDQPVLAVADGKALPNPHFRNGGPVYHALIIRGYDEDEFITNDPGTQFGENFRYKYNDLLNEIHDWNMGDVPNGRKVILVVE